MPKIIYPIAEIGSELFSFSLSLIPFTVLMLFMGLELSVNLLYIIPVIIIFSIFILSVGLILGSLNVFFRDVGILWITLNPALFFVSPIAYSYDIIPAKFNVLISLNPLYHFLVIIRNIIVENRAPVLYNLIICILVTIVLFLLAIFIYQKTRNSFISNL
jgi:ABC-type polysaccharide/polyol phosphate export permease